jgi:hypothetical protein
MQHHTNIFRFEFFREADELGKVGAPPAFFHPWYSGKKCLGSGGEYIRPHHHPSSFVPVFLCVTFC